MQDYKRFDRIVQPRHLFCEQKSRTNLKEIPVSEIRGNITPIY